MRPSPADQHGLASVTPPNDREQLAQGFGHGRARPCASARLRQRTSSEPLNDSACLTGRDRRLHSAIAWRSSSIHAGVGCVLPDEVISEIRERVDMVTLVGTMSA